MKKLSPLSFTLPFANPWLTGSPLYSLGAFYMMPKRSVEVICPVCKNTYILRPCEVGKIKTCSKECSSQHRSIVRTGLKHNIVRKVDKDRKCIECGTIFHKNHYKNALYCSPKCQNDAHSKRISKENHPCWKGGISKIIQADRKTREYAKWRRDIYKRDGFKCVKCGDNNRLHAHHIIPFSEDESKRTDINNGITLCLKCHGKIHGVDFMNKFHKCIDCNKPISNSATRCNSCRTKLQWKTKPLRGKLKLTK